MGGHSTMSDSVPICDVTHILTDPKSCSLACKSQSDRKVQFVLCTAVKGSDCMYHYRH